MFDPVTTEPDHYRVLWENDRVRVLEYHDSPGDFTRPHSHPDSVMVTLAPFSRIISDGEREVPVQLEAGQARWLDAQTHSGRNVGLTDTHSVFVELKEPRTGTRANRTRLGPSHPQP